MQMKGLISCKPCRSRHTHWQYLTHCIRDALKEDVNLNFRSLYINLVCLIIIIIIVVVVVVVVVVGL